MADTRLNMNGAAGGDKGCKHGPLHKNVFLDERLSR